MNIANVLGSSIYIGAAVLTKPADNARTVAGLKYVGKVISCTGDTMYVFVTHDATNSNAHSVVPLALEGSFARGLVPYYDNPCTGSYASDVFERARKSPWLFRAVF
jgi:hypothetical protein